jgi:SARP family transcriptional regulator, regulator of embCAB operon
VGFYNNVVEVRPCVADTQTQVIDFGVLGPLYVRAGSQMCAPTAPKLRNVLSTLIVNAGQVVPVSVLMRELWEGEPPTSWLTTLQTYILNLRKLFATTTRLPAAEVADRILVTRPGGYLLQLGSGTLDLDQYNRMVAAGREFLAAGDDLNGIRALDGGLRLWRGPAFLDVRGGRLLESKRRQLEESRLVVLECLIDAKLRLGMYHEVLSELIALTEENPLHEGLHAHQMLALHSIGRRAEALGVFRRLRDNLIAELGLEPGSRAQQMHQAVLNGDTELLMPKRRPLSLTGELERVY